MFINNKISNSLSGVYQIKNTITGDRYIGSSVSIRTRWIDHRASLRRGEHKNPILQNAYNKYGEDNFNFSILLLCSEHDTLKYEQAFLDKAVHHYNIATDATAPMLGRSMTREAKRKLSKANSGKNNRFYGRRHSKKTKDKISKAMSGANHPNYGKHLSSETREKIGKVHRNKSVSAETREKISKSLKGKYKGKNSSGYGTHRSEATKEKLRQANLGKKHTEETKIKCRDASNRYWSNRKKGESASDFHARMKGQKVK